LGNIIADNLKKAGWSYGYVSAIDSNGRTIWIADAHRGDGKRFVVRADELLTAFLELERQVLTVTFYLESIRADSCRCDQ
jgi:ABC-type phosphate transport system auxiliary subunit